MISPGSDSGWNYLTFWMEKEAFLRYMRFITKFHLTTDLFIYLSSQLKKQCPFKASGPWSRTQTSRIKKSSLGAQDRIFRICCLSLVLDLWTSAQNCPLAHWREELFGPQFLLLYQQLGQCPVACASKFKGRPFFNPKVAKPPTIICNKMVMWNILLK